MGLKKTPNPLWYWWGYRGVLCTTGEAQGTKYIIDNFQSSLWKFLLWTDSSCENALYRLILPIVAWKKRFLLAWCPKLFPKTQLSHSCWNIFRRLGPKAAKIAYSRREGIKSAVEGKAVVPSTLKGLWLLTLVGWRRWNFILAEEHFVLRDKQTKNPKPKTSKWTKAFHTPRNLQQVRTWGLLDILVRSLS